MSISLHSPMSQLNRLKWYKNKRQFYSLTINDVPGLPLDQENLDPLKTNFGFNWSGMVGDCPRLTGPLWELNVWSMYG